jgi:hypothetical protein
MSRVSSRIPAGDYCQALTAVRFLVEYPHGLVLAEFPAGRQ